jgi:hypothetical protein
MSIVLLHLRDGHKTLIFSRSKRMLDIMAFLLVSKEICFTRIDGNVLPRERSNLVKEFNNSDRSRVCLLTTQVGGVGLTFNSASRVILLDPSWNPSVDAQAVDRIHRIGQTKDVIVYRLITSGTVDEKIYRNQIFKTMAAKQLVGASTEDLPRFHRYFTRLELRSMFELGEQEVSETAIQLESAITAPLAITPELRRDLMCLDGVVGISDHSAVFGSYNDAAEEPPEETKHVNPPKSTTKRRRENRLVLPAIDISVDLGCDLCRSTSTVDLATGVELETSSCHPSARCSIFEQGVPLEDIVTGPDSDYFYYRGIQIPKLNIEEITRGSVAIDADGLDEKFFDDDGTHSEGYDSAEELADWDAFESRVGGGLEERRRHAVLMLHDAVHSPSSRVVLEPSHPRATELSDYCRPSDRKRISFGSPNERVVGSASSYYSCADSED